MTTLQLLAQACQRSCHPGDHPACEPVADPIVAPDGTLVATYACPVCGCCWRTSWSLADTWPVRRSVDVDPVTPEQAAENRGLLEAALDEVPDELARAA